MNYLSDNTSLDTASILRGDLSFTGCGNKNVALLTKQFLHVRILIRLSTGKALDGTMFKFVFFQVLGIDTIWINDGTIPFQDTDTSGTVSSEISSRMQTDIAETLVYNGCFSKYR
jgi:hypothetical protein